MLLDNFISLESLLLLFFIITYFISITEKISTWKKTIFYYTNHFQNSILEKNVVQSVYFVIILEILTLITLLIGYVNLLYFNTLIISIAGLTLSGFTLLVLLIGQRIAKDYVGATSITVYFILNILALYFLT